MLELWPFTNFHDLNLDWIIGKIKSVEDSEQAAKESAEAASGYAADAKSSKTQAAIFATRAGESANSAAADAGGVNSLRNQINTNTARIDAIENESSADANAELVDIRVDSIGYTFPTAGDATRYTDEIVKESNLIPYTNKTTYNDTNSGGIRILHGADFKAGKKYVLVMDIDSLGVNGNLYVRSCNDQYNASGTQQETFTTVTGPVNYHSQTIKFEIEPTVDANFLYLYIALGSPQQTYNFDLQLFVYENLSEWLPSMGGDWTRYRATLASNRSSINRVYYPYEFKAGQEYTVTMTVDRLYTEAWPTNLFILGTTVTDTSTNRVDLILRELNPDTSTTHNIVNKTYQQTFTATADAHYMYFYTAVVYQASPVVMNNICFDVVTNTLIAPMSAVSANAVKKYDNNYYGKLETNTNTYGIDDIPVTNSTNQYPQGMTIYNDKIFAARNTGIVEVYDLSGTYITTFNLASAGNTNHAGILNFSNTFYSPSDSYPLLYCKIGDGPNSFTCSVERIVESGGSFTATQIQTITLDQSNFAANGYTPCWGWPAFIPGEDLLYVYSSIYRTNGSMSAYYDDNRYLITAFPLPDISVSSVTITGDDVYKQTIAPYTAEFAQGATINGNSLIALYGDGSTFPTKVIQYNLWSGDITAMVDSPFTTEPEDCSVYNNNLYIQDASNNIWKLQIE